MQKIYRQNYQNNLQALRRYYPELALRYSHVSPETDVRAGEGCDPDLIFQAQGSLRLESDARRAIARLPAHYASVHVLLGLGLGHCLELLVETRQELITGLLILEPDVETFYRFLHRRDWTAFLTNPGIRFIQSSDTDAVVQAARALLPQIMGSGIQFVEPRRSSPLRQEFFTRAVDCLHLFLKQAAAESRFLAQYGALIQRNVLANLPLIAQSQGLLALRNLCAGQPAVLVAAGPSLNRNLSDLLPRRGTYRLFCVDTVYRLLLQHNLIPDFVAATDPTLLNEFHFKHLPARSDVSLLFESDLYPTIPSGWQGPLIFLNSEKAAVNQWIEKALGPYGYFESSLSVAHCLYTAAAWMGCDPIILVGFDLAYPREGGYTHATGTALNREIAASATGGKFVTIKGASFAPQDSQEELVWVPGYHGSSVPTSRTMSVFMHHLTALIREKTHRIWNATEGGARIEGTEQARLREVLASLPERGLPQISVQRKDISAVEEWKRELQSLLEEFQAAVQDARQGLQLVQEVSIRGVASGKASLRPCPEWSAMDDCFWRLYRNSALQVILGQAMFSCMYLFIRRESRETDAARLQKYQQVFQTVLQLRPHYLPLLERMLEP